MTRKGGRFSYAAEPEKTGEPEVLATPTELKRVGDSAKAASDPRHALQNPAAYALPPQRKGRREEDGTVKRTDVPREQLNVRIRPELKRAAAGLAGLEGMTLGDVVEAALIDYIRQHQGDEKS
ncbi:hypothetical protein [Deinococcus koreensis]|uniref:hypothetical protein n=1 Tax=Deinococcus koreensis TaxID=2054903 RepID=UPI0010572BCD|nr:hypothetical protein [Deinococcus koreensis]